MLLTELVTLTWLAWPMATVGIDACFFRPSSLSNARIIILWHRSRSGRNVCSHTRRVFQWNSPQWDHRCFEAAPGRTAPVERRLSSSLRCASKASTHCVGHFPAGYRFAMRAICLSLAKRVRCPFSTSHTSRVIPPNPASANIGRRAPTARSPPSKAHCPLPMGNSSTFRRTIALILSITQALGIPLAPQSAISLPGGNFSFRCHRQIMNRVHALRKLGNCASGSTQRSPYARPMARSSDIASTASRPHTVDRGY